MPDVVFVPNEIPTASKLNNAFAAKVSTADVTALVATALNGLSTEAVTATATAAAQAVVAAALAGLPGTNPLPNGALIIEGGNYLLLEV